jgi:hypothetical protein
MATIAGGLGVLKKQVDQGPEALSSHWSGEDVQAACQACEYSWRDRVWTPVETLWTFLLQVLHAGSSCRAAVALSQAGRMAAGLEADESADPSAYCGGRLRLPLEVFRHGVRTVGQRLEQRVGDTRRWLGHRVWVVDGTTCSMPDTRDLQKTFGQPSGQAKGCGFPVARIVGLFCWASGAVLEAAIGAYRQSELSLWRTLWHLLKPGDVVLGDRLYCTYADISGLVARGCDAVFRLHAKRPRDMRQGKPLGKDDRLVTWRRPTFSARPRGMTWRGWQALPETLTLRVLRFNVDVRGFRARRIFVATTLLDPVAYPAATIAALYRDRWLIELRFRDIKITLGMDVVRGKTADIVRKEILMHLLAYNLIRCLMWEAATQRGIDLHRLSFAGAVDRLNVFLPYLWLFEGTPKAQGLYDLLLRSIARDLLPRRPNRVEPRAVKRRPKQYALLNKPRRTMRKALST